MERAQAVLLAVKNGIQVICTSRPDPKKNVLNEETLIQLIDAIKKELKNG
jgi:alanine-alpha-ketoisovalerate/valine-pyruvate aminotransferase